MYPAHERWLEFVVVVVVVVSWLRSVKLDYLSTLQLIILYKRQTGSIMTFMSPVNSEQCSSLCDIVLVSVACLQLWSGSLQRESLRVFWPLYLASVIKIFCQMSFHLFHCHFVLSCFHDLLSTSLQTDFQDYLNWHPDTNELFLFCINYIFYVKSCSKHKVVRISHWFHISILEQSSTARTVWFSVCVPLLRNLFLQTQLLWSIYWKLAWFIFKAAEPTVPWDCGRVKL